MCGRYSLATPDAIIAEAFELSEPPGLMPRYNIAPTQSVAVVRAGADGSLRLGPLRWGLVPSWARDPGIGARLINARSETAADKPAFRSAFRSRRCLIVADGFYEWRRGRGRTQPFHVRYRDARPFAFAGLWERWEKGDGPPLESCTILTCPPNSVVAPVHDRMPVILEPDMYRRWLDVIATGPEEATALLRPAADVDMEAFPVSTTVNSPANDSAACREPLPGYGR